jgi:ELWxxDGT repeat protein
VSDGTTTGTQLVTDISINPSSTSFLFPTDLTVVGNELFFAADDGTTGNELFKLTFDGSATIYLYLYTNKKYNWLTAYSFLKLQL